MENFVQHFEDKIRQIKQDSKAKIQSLQKELDSKQAEIDELKRLLNEKNGDVSLVKTSSPRNEELLSPFSGQSTPVEADWRSPGSSSDTSQLQNIWTSILDQLNDSWEARMKSVVNSHKQELKQKSEQLEATQRELEETKKSLNALRKGLKLPLPLLLNVTPTSAPHYLSSPESDSARSWDNPPHCEDFTSDQHEQHSPLLPPPPLPEPLAMPPPRAPSPSPSISLCGSWDTLTPRTEATISNGNTPRNSSFPHVPSLAGKLSFLGHQATSAASVAPSPLALQEFLISPRRQEVIHQFHDEVCAIQDTFSILQTRLADIQFLTSQNEELASHAQNLEIQVNSLCKAAETRASKWDQERESLLFEIDSTRIQANQLFEDLEFARAEFSEWRKWEKIKREKAANETRALRKELNLIRSQVLQMHSAWKDQLSPVLTNFVSKLLETHPSHPPSTLLQKSSQHHRVAFSLISDHDSSSAVSAAVKRRIRSSSTGTENLVGQPQQQPQPQQTSEVLQHLSPFLRNMAMTGMPIIPTAPSFVSAAARGRSPGPIRPPNTRPEAPSLNVGGPGDAGPGRVTRLPGFMTSALFTTTQF